MKQITSTIIALFFATAAFSQEKEKITDDGNNEIKINLAYFVFEIVELSYERILMDEFSVGIAANYWFDDYSNIDYMFNPFFRFYPLDTKRRGATFFIEGNAALLGVTEQIYMTDFNNGFWEHSYEETNVTRGGAGVAVGGKFLSKNHFVGEAYLGLGRIFGSNNFPEVYPRAGITFGKRF
jgi:hypothetical protein